MAERTTDTFGNIALIQSFARIESEVSLMRSVGDKLLGAQMPVLSWWALAAVLSRTATTLTMLAILVVGIFLYLAGHSTVGEIVMFMSFATLLIGKLESVVYFANHLVMDAPRLQEFFDVLDTVPAVRDRPDAMDPGRLRGLIELKTSPIPMMASALRSRTCTSPRFRERRLRWWVRPAPASPRRSGSCTASSTPSRARSRSTAWTSAR